MRKLLHKHTCCSAIAFCADDNSLKTTYACVQCSLSVRVCMGKTRVISTRSPTSQELCKNAQGWGSGSRDLPLRVKVAEGYNIQNLSVRSKLLPQHGL